ncbi:MAG: tRNA delta(2)-isopentenylpyrophosphate transferase [uncultured bacterium]|nr:MAG: tRNA delta(2)-isopentenylpyrophosphate transferase [uncultured bacterium]HCU71087.1 tRNA (adenosine(37)-N6)-dimethylallyltransferase MiaA [Candidatus Moranbacteria bacterium]
MVNIDEKKFPKIIVILGPTASGKSATAIRLAKKFNGEVISVDSRQIYRGLDVGSGKILKDSLSKATDQKDIFLSEGIRHYMLDIVSPRTNFSAAQFKKKSDRIISDILKRDKLPILCGGTGFWIQAVVDDMIYPEVKPDWKLRKKLEKKSTEKLFAQLKKIDPTRAKNIDSKNKVRLIRAIEICQSLGKVPAKIEKADAKYNFLQIGIQRDREILHKKIELNVKKRFRQGMIAEVENLKNSGLSWRKIESFGLSYRLIPKYLRREIETKEELLEKICIDEKNYAKRQITWFKKDKRIVWIEKFKDIEKITASFLNA